MIIKTQNSTYEIDYERKRLRKLKGEHASDAKRVGTGGWRAFESTYPEQPTAGSRLLIVWPDDTPRLDGSQYGVTTTITSFVMSVEEEASGD